MSVSNFRDHHLFNIVSIFFEKSHDLPSATVVSNSEHEQFCTPRPSFEASESSQIAVKVRKRLPPNSTLEAPGRPVRMRKLLAPDVVHLGQSLSLDQVDQVTSLEKAWRTTWTTATVSLKLTSRKKTRKVGANVKARRARRRTRVHSELLRSASADAKLAKPARECDTVISRETLLLKNVQAVHLTVHRRRAVRLWRTNDGGCLRRFPGLQPDGTSGLAASHTQPATQSSDVGVLGGHLLATRGTRSCADGTVRTPGFKTMRSGETCERRLPLLGTAAASPGKSQTKQHAAIRRRERPGLPMPEWEDLFLAMSNTHDHRPIWNLTYPVQQAASETGLGTVTLYQLRHSGASVDIARQYRTLDAVQKRGAWSQTRHVCLGDTSVQILQKLQAIMVGDRART